MTQPYRPAVLSIALALCSVPALAQSADSARAVPARQSAADAELEIVTVLGRRAAVEAVPGSHAVLDARELAEAHVMSTSEALRKAPGVNVRDEEGFGLRPNIGLRGLNPTRSTKLLLLEDGIPLAYAP
ncbi:MAG: TonB-dependent receptor plug domain-containing protein [Gammaproteobacteria bacterium]